MSIPLTAAEDSSRNHDRLNAETRAIRMLHSGDPVKLVAQTTGLDVDIVKQLQRDFPGSRRSSAQPAAGPSTAPPTDCGHVTDLPLALLREHPSNVRTNLGPDRELEELTESIRQQGVLQPIVVMRLDRQYVVLAGHRRLAAAARAGLTRVPVTLRPTLDDHRSIEAMLVENLQRSALNPLDEAEAYRQLIAAGRNASAVARAVGKDPGHVSARLALLNLTGSEQDALRRKEITVADAYLVGRDRSPRRRPDDVRRPKPKVVPHFTKTHPLAAQASALCTHDTLLKLGVACGPCWEHTIHADERGVGNLFSSEEHTA